MNDDVCAGILFSGWMPCYLIFKISTKMPDKNVEPLHTTS